MNMGTIGDIVMSIPIAQSLKLNNINTKITWVAQPEFTELLENNPNIDEVIPWDFSEFSDAWYSRKYIKAFKCLHKLKNKLTSRRYDVALDLQGTLTSGLATKTSKATHRIALGAEEGSNWLMTKTISRTLGDKIQLGSEYRYLVTQLGLSDRDWNLQLPLHKESEETASKLLKERIGDDKYAIICPFSNRPSKLWNNEYWQQIALRIRGRYRLRTIILGGENETESAQDISKFSGAVDLTGKTSLLQAAEIIRNAQFVVGIDTGLTHMAHAVKTPTLSLFGPTFPYAFAGTDDSQVISSNLYCSPCNYNPTCKNKFTCMKEISPDRVLTEIKPIMQLAEANEAKSLKI